MAFDWLIRGGTVLDGTGTPGRRADVALSGDRVTAVAPDLPGEAGQVVDATGCMVAPGFIDMHAHSDFALLAYPSAEAKIRQGVTTEVTGMCGFSPAPAPPGGGLLREWAAFLSPQLDWRWTSFGSWLDRLRQAGLMRQRRALRRPRDAPDRGDGIRATASHP
jgi:N-acyl-D-aspartate/D-glutamate deacylase